MEIKQEFVWDKKILEKNLNTFYSIFIKRVIDFCLSIFLFILLLPIILLICSFQIIFNGFPIFYTPLRGGYKDVPFRIIKFRTMVKNADQIGEGTTSLNDSRITKFGHILRKTKLDEIPQIINVILGKMSFIGPRPELIKYTSNYNRIQKTILKVRPGITDYSSLQFINLDEIVGSKDSELFYEENVLRKKNNLRLKYVSDISFKTDFIIFIKTIYSVLLKIIRFFIRGK